MAPWNEQLVNLAHQIHQSRTDYIERINEVLERGLFERREIQIRYVSSLEGKGDLRRLRSRCSTTGCIFDSRPSWPPAVL